MSDTQNKQDEQAGVSLDSAVRAMLAPVEAQLARLEGQLQSGLVATPASSTNSESAPAAAAAAPVSPADSHLEANLLAKIDACHADLLAKLAELLTSYQGSLPQSAESEDDVPEFPTEPIAMQPVVPVAAQPVIPVASSYANSGASTSGDAREFSLALLGPLANEPAMDAEELLADLSRGDIAAQAFVGQLLLARSSDSIQLAPLLKDLGEAYYRWRPRRSAEFHPSELVLAQWLVDHLAEVGLTNKIELVRIGDRFDQSRHRAEERGVEVIAVHGWVVLRENGKVYTKASVSVA